jgi:DNA polymerase III epsilon subunit-like protein|mmetsp:Transcript_11233/g.20270  ORF Transcript_11233/g.20270 Transcript_11233/m.20270 type:complete len:89 (-) Transcript_11233:415-681(-)
MAPPTAAEARSLFRLFLRTAQGFEHYNMKAYVARRAGEGFRKHSAEKDPEMLSQLWKKAQDDLAITKRQSILYGLYGAPHKSIMHNSK